jgi:peptidoglycan L-alanyl-D-glutamate endopeptidase CwlK
MAGQIRDINRLNWYVKEEYLKLESKCKQQGVKIVVFETVRSDNYQLQLWNMGRLDKTKPIVTNMKKPVAHSESIAIAFDIYVEVGGKAIWDGSHPHWQIVLKIAREMGFRCGHDWKMRDTCHFQLDEGLSTKDLQLGKRPSWFYKKDAKLSPYETLQSKLIMSKTGFDWKLNCEQNKLIRGDFCKALLVNFYKYKTKQYSFTMTNVIDYLFDNKVLSDKSYWLERCQSGKFIEGQFMKIVIERISKLV